MTTDLDLSDSAPDVALARFGWDVPAWIDQDITLADLASIEYGGCASGAYMPAVIYHKAMATMGEYGDDVLESLDDYVDAGLVTIKSGESWAGLCCQILSTAVEVWASRELDAWRERFDNDARDMVESFDDGAYEDLATDTGPDMYPENRWTQLAAAILDGQTAEQAVEGLVSK